MGASLANLNLGVASLCSIEFLLLLFENEGGTFIVLVLTKPLLLSSAGTHACINAYSSSFLLCFQVPAHMLLAEKSQT